MGPQQYMPALPGSRGSKDSFCWVSELNRRITVVSRGRRGLTGGVPGEDEVESRERRLAAERGEHERQFGAVLGGGEGDAQRHEQVAGADAALLAPGAIGGEELAGCGGREPLRRLGAKRSRVRQLRRGGERRGDELREADGGASTSAASTGASP